ncbi:hypothetical protein PTKIN_Ptkin15bG0046100 [Pterospermum kingtungense]
MEVDWDLHAVVRGCATVTTTSSGGGVATSSFMADLHPQSCFSSFGSQEAFKGQLLSFSNQFEARNDMEESHELYKPFFPKSQPLSPQSTPLSSLSSLGLSKDQTHIKQEQQQPNHSHAGSVASAVTTASSNSATASSHHSRSKKRKSQLKRVCQVPAEGLSADVWAWRKYGQKPIKGSPYPRGYYRCSSSKGCVARKQVERNGSDPTMFIVTYTGEHNHPAPTHRNSLAGSTRQRPSPPQTVTGAGDSPKPSSAKPSTSSSPITSVDEELVVQSTKVDSGEDLAEDEEDDLGLSDTAVSDDFFEGLEEFADMVTGDCFSNNFRASFDLPWIANDAATAADGI